MVNHVNFSGRDEEGVKVGNLEAALKKESEIRECGTVTSAAGQKDNRMNAGELLKGTGTRVGAAAKGGAAYGVANGVTIPNMGEKTFSLHTAKGAERKWSTLGIQARERKQQHCKQQQAQRRH